MLANKLIFFPLHSFMLCDPKKMTNHNWNTKERAKAKQTKINNAS